MTQRVDAGRSFINYVNPGEIQGAAPAPRAPAGPAAPAAPAAPARMPPPPDFQANRIGEHLAAVLEHAKLSGSISSEETTIVLKKLGNIRTAAALAEAYRVVASEVQDALIDLKDRSRLEKKLLDVAGKVPGGQNVVSPALTEAVGEDIFGMGALPLNSVEKLALKASKNDLIGRAETNALQKELANVGSGWELTRAYNALRLVINGCAISREDRLDLHRAYNEAAQRVGDAFMPMTRAMNEDIFGVRPNSMALDVLAKADRNKALNRLEVTKLAAEIGKITTPTELGQVYVALDTAVSGTALITQKARRELIGALIAADQRLGGGTIPLAVTLAVNEDQFGIGKYPLHLSQKVILSAGEDALISKQERQHLEAAIGKIATKEEFEQAFPAIRSAVSLNLITREDRELLREALNKASERVESYLAVTRGLFEDVFGFYPPV